jgi:hypothetical protein
MTHLEEFFRLASKFRTSNILYQTVIVQDALPDLASKTSSVRLKGAISTFLAENAHVSTANQGRRTQS